MILLENSFFEVHKENIEKFITFLWDMNLNIGHSVRTIDDCHTEAEKDITIATNLMETRTIAGSKTLLERMSKKVGPKVIWPSKEFFEAKWKEQISRHFKYNNTEYNLEPNVKSCPGGLRDIQMIGWVAKRHFGASHINELVIQGFLTDEELEIINTGQEFLGQVRYALHMITDRAEDRLLFDHQKTIAKLMGYEDNDEKLAVEQFMQQYFRWAIALAELNDMLMQHFDEAILRACEPEVIFEINPRFRLRNNYIEVTNAKVFKKFPSALMEIFVLSAQNTNVLGVRASTIRLLREHRHLIDDEFRNDTRNQQLFLELLRSPSGVASQLKHMKRYGILGKYIPEFGRIIGQTQHDLFHIYTVDAHTILVIKNMRRFSYPDMQKEFPIAAHIVRRLPKIELLYIAGLFHDIAKGRGGNHSELGAEDAYRFCQHHGFNKRDSNLVSWLVRKHLLMTSISQRKDISDPDVIRDFAMEVGDQLHLNYLFVLTVADMNATNPTIWNSWRASLMRQLYLETKRALRRGLEHHIDRQDWIEDTQNAAIAKLMSKGFTREQILNTWDYPGEDYFLRETSNDIAWQTEAIAKHKNKDEPLVLVKENSEKLSEGATQIFIHTKSRNYLFALVASTLEGLDLSIQDARIYRSAGGYTMDTFYVLDIHGGAIGNDQERIAEIKTSLHDQLAEEQDYSEIVQRRTPRKLKYFSIPTRTSISTDFKNGHTVLEVITPDRPGLLARIGRIFVTYGIQLQAAKITTLGERVEDVFFITDYNNEPINDPLLCEDIQRAIRQTLDEKVAEQG
jgi:[protein-PII] uridylyltransferase